MSESSAPLISIVSPAYHCAPYIEQMVKSIQAQTWTNWELLLVDDGSDDGGLDVMCALAKTDPRILVKGILHVGYAEAFNMALSMASGRIIARQDADDWSDPTRLEKQVNLLCSGEYDIVSCDMLRAWPDGTITHVRTGVMVPEQWESMQPGCGTVIATKKTYERVGGLITKWELSGDSEWFFRALVLDDPPIRWGHVDEYLYVYRSHSQQMSGLDRTKTWEIHRQVLNLHRLQIQARLNKGTPDVCGPS